MLKVVSAAAEVKKTNFLSLKQRREKLGNSFRKYEGDAPYAHVPDPQLTVLRGRKFGASFPFCKTG